MIHKIINLDGNELREVESEPVEIAGFKCAIREDEDGDFIVTELTTGAMVCWSFDREHAIMKALGRLESDQCPDAMEKVKARIVQAGFTYPVNDLSLTS